MEEEKKILLEARSLYKTLRRMVNFKMEINKPSKNVSLNLKEGEILGILGPNGAGKSTALRMITGELTPDEGCILFNGQDITNWPMYKRCSAGLAYMPQEPSLFKQMTVEDNLIGIMQMQGFAKQECRSRCEELMEIFNLNHIRHSLAGNISGGEKRRLEVARVLTKLPKILVLDEPFAGVDPIVTKMITDLIIDLWENWGISIIITDHDYRCITQMIERSYVIFGGEVVFEGTPEQMVNDEFVQQIYLGKDESEIITIDEFGYRRVKSLLDSHRKKRNSNLQTSLPSASQNNAPPLINFQNNPVEQERENAFQSANTVSEQFDSENVYETAMQQETTTDSELSELMPSVQTNEFQTNEMDNKPSATLADFFQNYESGTESLPQQNMDWTSEQTSDQTNNLQRQRKIPLSGPTIRPFRRKK